MRLSILFCRVHAVHILFSFLRSFVAHRLIKICFFAGKSASIKCSFVFCYFSFGIRFLLTPLAPHPFVVFAPLFSFVRPNGFFCFQLYLFPRFYFQNTPNSQPRIIYIFQPIPDPMEDVKKDIEAVKSKISQNTVAYALQYLRQLLSRPQGAFDAHATMAALEHLVDTARENSDADVSRYNAILKQTRGLADNPALQRILLKLLGSKEEIAIAKEIDKATKGFSPTPLLRGPQMGTQPNLPRVQPYNFPRGRFNSIICFSCGRPGHIARNCRVKKGRY